MSTFRSVQECSTWDNRAIKALSAKSKPTSSSFEIKPVKYPRIVCQTQERRVAMQSTQLGEEQRAAAGTLQPARKRTTLQFT